MFEKLQSAIERETKIEITSATPKDVLGIRDLEYKTWMATYPGAKSGITPEDIDWYFNKFKKSFSPQNIEKTTQEIKNLPADQHVVVAKNEEGEIVGYAWLMKRDNENELGAIYVNPEYQGMNLGKKIWSEAQSFFNSNTQTMLTVEENNLRAIKFYEKLGFKDTGKRMESLTFPSGAKFSEIEMKRDAGL